MNDDYQQLCDAGSINRTYQAGPTEVPLQDVCDGVIVVRGAPTVIRGQGPPLLEGGVDMEFQRPRILHDIHDYLAWSLCSLMYWNVCCLGYVASVFSIKSRDRKYLGDLEGARRYGNISMVINIVQLVVNLVAVGLFIYGLVVFSNTLSELLQKIDHENRPATLSSIQVSG